MGSQTPILALPYPVGTDLIADGDNAIQSLAQRVETLLTPVWTALPFAAGWQNQLSGFQTCEYAKCFGWLFLRGHAYSTSNSANVTTLPAGYRVPAQLIYSVNYWNGSVVTVGQLNIYPTGVIATAWAPANGHSMPLTLPPIWVGP